MLHQAATLVMTVVVEKIASVSAALLTLIRRGLVRVDDFRIFVIAVGGDQGTHLLDVLPGHGFQPIPFDSYSDPNSTLPSGYSSPLSANHHLKCRHV
jgi:hypothetical protein